MRKVVVVGNGFGGVKTALELGNKSGIEVTLLAANDNFEYHGALYRSATGRSPLEVVVPLRDIFCKAKNVNVVLDKAASIDAVKHRVVSELGNVYPYDTLVLALGNEVNYFGIDGMPEHSYTLDTISNTIAIRHGLVRLCKNTVMPRVAIIGAGPSGVELAGELQNFANMIAAKYGGEPANVQVCLVEAGAAVLPMMGEHASHKALHRLQALRVNVLLSTTVNACRPGTVCLASGDLHADMIVWTAGSKPVGFFANQPSIFALERGRVVVDQNLKAAGHDNIYVIGDNASTQFTGMAQTALHNAVYASGHILGKSLKPYKPKPPVCVVPIGPRWALVKSGSKIYSGYRGWLARRRGDLEIFESFEPYKKAIKTWRKGNHKALF